MHINLHELPFSVYGSYLVLGHLHNKKDSDSFYLRSVHSEESGQSLFRLGVFKGGQEIVCRETAKPGLLVLEAEENVRVLITYQSENALRFRAENCEVRLQRRREDSACLMYPLGEDGYEANFSSHKMMFSCLQGEIDARCGWGEKSDTENILILNPKEEPVAEAVLEEYENIWEKKEYGNSLEEAAAGWEMSYLDFLETLPKVPEKYESSREKAGYINWSCVVYPKGNLKRHTMLMSKNWMTNVWSWDHCFNAMASAKGDPAFAWDQIMLMFDQQDGYGALPDAMNDTVMIRNFVKPPIHGLTLTWMEKHTEVLTEGRVKEIYPKLCRWTDFWMLYRDTDHDGIPEYHHGNDSGWDNSTVFKDSLVVEGTDLSAFLILQMEALENMAKRLEVDDEVENWKQRKEQLLENMLAHFGNNGDFKGCISGSHKISSNSSLLNYMALVLGERLPGEIREKLLAELLEEGAYQTAWGFATEKIKSEFYESDGYWRGPIWAPSTWLLVKGLQACGRAEEARKTAEKFCELCDKNGFAENFDAISGEGLRDRAYTWTASVFLLLASEL